MSLEVGALRNQNQRLDRAVRDQREEQQVLEQPCLPGRKVGGELRDRRIVPDDTGRRPFADCFDVRLGNAQSVTGRLVEPDRGPRDKAALVVVREEQRPLGDAKRSDEQIEEMAGDLNTVRKSGKRLEQEPDRVFRRSEAGQAAIEYA